MASWSRRVTTISSPGAKVAPMARLSANVMVVMLGPKLTSSASVAPSRSAVATRTSWTSSSVSRLAAKAPPWLALLESR